MPEPASSFPGLPWAGLRSPLRWARAHAAAVLNGVAALFWAALGVSAISRLDLSWDSLAYHLPFASRWAGIFPKSGYLFYPWIEALFEGGPKLPQFMQGLLWRATGLISATNLFGLLCLLLLAIVASVRLRLSFWLFTLWFFSVPLILYHSVSSYVDLPAASFVALALVNLLAASDQRRFDNRSLLLILLPLALAANSKFQAVEIALPFFVVVCAAFLLRNAALAPRDQRPSGAKHWVGFALVSLASACLFGWNYVANWVRFNNPVYPVSAQVGSISLEGPWGIERGLSHYQNPRAKWSRYVRSLSEIELWTNNRGHLWSIDMGSVWKAKEEASFKTGGFFGANLVLWGSFLLVSVLSTRSRRAGVFLAFVLGNFLLVGFLPDSAILRYWLFLPLELAVLTLWMSRHNPVSLKPVFHLVVMLQLVIFAFVIYQNPGVLPGRETFSTLGAGVQGLDGIMRKHRVDLDSSSYVCVVSTDTRRGFQYKLANPQLPIQSATSEAQCLSPTILYP